MPWAHSGYRERVADHRPGDGGLSGRGCLIHPLAAWLPQGVPVSLVGNLARCGLGSDSLG
ncbi:hypothetical protein BN9982_160058 [Mycobacterium tuberculosis]|nr:hypothetical protein BN9982_160058 [Mycobacterium tuberculosis]